MRPSGILHPDRILPGGGYMSDLNRPGTFLRVALSILIILISLTSVTRSAGARQTSGQEPLDLGGMVLNASDLADLELEGYRVRGSQAIDTAELADRYAAQLGQ